MIQRSDDGGLSRLLGIASAAAVSAAAVFAFAGLASPHAHAFPDKPIRVVIGFPAGGPLDQHARLLADRLGQQLGQSVLIDYRAGAGGSIGAQEGMRAPADGHTLMLAKIGRAHV